MGQVWGSPREIEDRRQMALGHDTAGQGLLRHSDGEFQNWEGGRGLVTGGGTYL